VTEIATTENKHALPLRLKLLFSIGDLTTSMPQAIIVFFQLYFLTDVAGLRPDYAAWAIAAGRFWDAINDPLFGIISDRIKSPHGRRRVLLLFGAVPLGLTYSLMWFVPQFGQAGLAVFYALIFILFDTCYTAVHVGYNSLTPELTSDYDERSSLNGYRMAISISGTLGAIIFATVLGWYIEDVRRLYMVLGVGLGLLSVLPPLIVFRVTGNYRSMLDGEPLPAQESVLTTIRNRPFQMVMGLYLMSWTAASIMAAVLVYFANYYLGVPDQANYLVLAAQGSAVVFVPAVVWLSRRFDKRRAFIIGCVTWIVFLVSIILLQPGQIGLAFACAIFSGLGIATVYVVPWAMLPDIIEHDELNTGQRREGSFYALAAFFQKLGTGAALWVMGQIFALTGYIRPTPDFPLPAQPEGAIMAIRWFASIVPAGLVLVSILFAWRYSITREAHERMLEQLGDTVMPT
jgi:GPH family glycoside/pentoside/hexuronide:cation symporter